MGNINCLERSGKWLFSGSSFGSVKVWDLETNALVKLLKREKLGPITQICVYKNLLISATGKQEIIIWDLNDYSLAKTIQIDGKIANIAIMNNLLLACLQNGCIKVFNMNTYSNVSTFQSLPTRSIKIKNNCIITSAVAGMRTTKMHVLDFNFDPAQFLDIANATLNQRNHLVEQFETLGYSCQMAILNEYNTLSNLDELNEMDFFSNPITDPVKLNNLAEAIYRVVLKEVFNHLDNGQRRYAFNLFKKLPEAFIQAHLDELIAKLGPDAKRILKEYFNINIDKQ
jgi:hypothetical protein